MNMERKPIDGLSSAANDWRTFAYAVSRCLPNPASALLFAGIRHTLLTWMNLRPDYISVASQSKC